MARCWHTLTDRRHGGHGYVLAWPREQFQDKVLMDDIEGILMVLSLYVDGGQG
jgi:hypothetical protein